MGIGDWGLHKVEDYLANSPDWLKDIAGIYGSNPYKVLVFLNLQNNYIIQNNFE